MANKNYVLNADQLTVSLIVKTADKSELSTGNSLSIAKGTVSGLVGNTSAEKSAILEAVFGTGNASVVQVILNGVRINAAYTKYKLINFLPAAPFLPQKQTLQQVLRRYEIAEAMVAEYCSGFELSKQIEELAANEERLFSAIVLLLAATRFTLLDEPFRGLSAKQIDELTALIEVQKTSKGILIGDQNSQHITAISDSLYVVDNGILKRSADKNDQ
jgi:lipopolysaccharide export system ATP-binding protein